jgi:uncharacterized protein (DUF433 family)
MQMSRLERITFNPQQCGGKPCIRGKRIRVQDGVELLADGMTPEEVTKQLPAPELEDVRACLEFAAIRVAHPTLGVA